MNISLAPEILFHIGSVPVTNTLIWCIAIAIFIMAIAIFMKLRMKEIPTRFQGLIEILIDGGYTFVKNVTGSEEKAKKIFPLVMTLFTFILVCNLVTFIPGQSAFTLEKEEGSVAIFRAVMSDYGLIFLMTMMTIIITQIVIIAVHGPLGFAGKYINLKGFFVFFKELFKGKFKPGLLAQGLLDFVLGIMDIIGEIAKVISLSFRLFGNIFAGEVLTAVVLFLAPFFMPLPFMILGLLSAIVQAFVFSVLTLIFVTMASETAAEA